MLTGRGRRACEPVIRQLSGVGCWMAWKISLRRERLQCLHFGDFWTMFNLPSMIVWRLEG